MSVNSILSKLNQLSNDNLVSVYIPSAKREMKFKQLSVKQQKDLIKTGLDGTISGLTFNNAVSDIIADNSIENYEFLVVDRYPIILALRKYSFGTKFVSRDGETEETIDLDDIISKNLEFSQDFCVIIPLNEEVSAYIDVCSLKTDKTINDYQISAMKKRKDESISDSIGEIFVLEIVKFITKLNIGSDSIEMSTLSIKDRVSIVESIPVTLNNLILEYIQLLRKTEMEYLKVGDVQLQIDARLFSME
jgi:hypothetical protein